MMGGGAIAIPIPPPQPQPPHPPHPPRQPAPPPPCQPPPCQPPPCQPPPRQPSPQPPCRSPACAELAAASADVSPSVRVSIDAMMRRFAVLITFRFLRGQRLVRRWRWRRWCIIGSPWRPWCRHRSSHCANCTAGQCTNRGAVPTAGKSANQRACARADPGSSNRALARIVRITARRKAQKHGTHCYDRSGTTPHYPSSLRM